MFLLSTLLLCFLLTSDFVQGATNTKKSQLCSQVCTKCDEIKNLFTSSCDGLSCSCFGNVHTVDKEKKDIKTDCPKIKNYCPSGHVIKNNCPTNECMIPTNCLSMKEFKGKCTMHCPFGYAIDSDSCPICQCICPLVTRDICEKKCHPSDFTLSKTSDNCTMCECQKVIVRTVPAVVRSCPIIDKSKDCPINCSRVELVQDSESKCPVCRCVGEQACPLTRITCPKNCDNVQMLYDKNGCAISCKCACPYIKCARDCGLHDYKSNSNGCTTCVCNCPKLECAESSHCAVQKIKFDQYGCPTCQCHRTKHCPVLSSSCAGKKCGNLGYKLDSSKCSFGCSCDCPRLDPVKHCPKDCKNQYIYSDKYGCRHCTCVVPEVQPVCSAKPDCLFKCDGNDYDYIMDSTGKCPIDCKCKCLSTGDLYKICDKKCDVVQIFKKRGRYCLSCDCVTTSTVTGDNLKCPLSPTCTNDCGPIGFVVNEDGCQQSCKCNCPSTTCSSDCNWGFKKDSYGCDSCNCCENQDWNCWMISNTCVGKFERYTKLDGCISCKCVDNFSK